MFTSAHLDTTSGYMLLFVSFLLTLLKLCSLLHLRVYLSAVRRICFFLGQFAVCTVRILVKFLRRLAVVYLTTFPGLFETILLYSVFK